jgi:hypothetical protein
MLLYETREHLSLKLRAIFVKLEKLSKNNEKHSSEFSKWNILLAELCLQVLMRGFGK